MQGAAQGKHRHWLQRPLLNSCKELEWKLPCQQDRGCFINGAAMQPPPPERANRSLQ